MSEVRSPGTSSDQFDALIELLATDDARDDSNFHIVPEGTASAGLRDAEGKLDYAKIRSLFSQRRVNDNGDHVFPSSEPQNEPNSGIKLPQIVVEEPTALAEGSLTEPLPQPEQRDAESGEIEAMSKGGDVHYSQSVLPSEASGDSLVRDLEDALSKAKEDVAQLQLQVLQLQTQATELFKPNPSQEERDMRDTRGYLANATKPATSTLSYVQDAFATGTTELLTPTNVDRPDMEHARQFLIRADELVWRRSRYPNGPRAPVFSQNNVDALLERLTLWENILRAPVP